MNRLTIVWIAVPVEELPRFVKVILLQNFHRCISESAIIFLFKFLLQFVAVNIIHVGINGVIAVLNFVWSPFLNFGVV